MEMDYRIQRDALAYFILELTNREDLNGCDVCPCYCSNCLSFDSQLSCLIRIKEWAEISHGGAEQGCEFI